MTERRQRRDREIGSDARLPPDAENRIGETLARVRDLWRSEQLLVERQPIADDEPGVSHVTQVVPYLTTSEDSPGITDLAS
jgi:hypothetical protein